MGGWLDGLKGGRQEGWTDSLILLVRNTEAEAFLTCWYYQKQVASKLGLPGPRNPSAVFPVQIVLSSICPSYPEFKCVNDTDL